ncbi:MAG: hypothetical protein AB1775_14140 [Bacteroidota bacterium]
MSIRLETSKKNGIDNFQDKEISSYQMNLNKELPSQHPNTIIRTKPSPVYNCHGLTFASRRTRIEKCSNINKILCDDSYIEVTDIKEVLPGDIVVYYSSTGDPNHSGIVVENNCNSIIPLICSKWGSAGEFIHSLRDCPRIYGPNFKFYRCRL